MLFLKILLSVAFFWLKTDNTSGSTSAPTLIDQLIRVAKVDEQLRSSRFDVIQSGINGQSFSELCSLRPASLPEPLRSACRSARLSVRGLTAFHDNNDLAYQVLGTRRLNRFGGGLPANFDNSNVGEAVQFLANEIAEDVKFFLEDIFPDLLVPDIVKVSRPLDLTTTKCHERFLDFDGFPTSNTCSHTLRTRVFRIPYAVLLYPPVVYRLPQLKFESTESLLFSRIFPEWNFYAPFKIDQNLRRTGVSFLDMFQGLLDSYSATLLAGRAQADLKSFDLAWAKNVAFKTRARDPSLRDLIRLEEEARLQSALADSVSVESISGTFSAARTKLEHLGLLGELAYLKGDGQGSIGSLEFPLAQPISVVIAENILREAGLHENNRILEVRVDFLGLAGPQAVLTHANSIRQIVDTLRQLRDLMNVSDFLSLSEIGKDLVGSLSKDDYGNLIIHLLEAFKNRQRVQIGRVGGISAGIDQIKHAYRGALNHLNGLTSLNSGLPSAVSVKIVSAKHFCHIALLPTYYWDPSKAGPGEKEIQHFFNDRQDPLNIIRRLNALVYSSGYPDLATFQADPLRFLKLHNQQKPIGGFFVNLFPEYFVTASQRNLQAVSPSVLQYARDYVRFLSKYNSFDECSRVSFGPTGDISIKPQDVLKPGCIFGVPIYGQRLKSVQTPFLPQSEIVELIRTSTQSFRITPHLWPQRNSASQRSANLAPSNTSQTSLRHPFLPLDRFVTRNTQRNLLPKCVDYETLTQANFDTLLSQRKHLRLTNEKPNIFYVWTTRRCCLRGRGVNYE